MLKAVKNFYYYHQYDAIHAIKYVLAFLIGYSIMQFFPDGKSQWIMITIAVIMGSQAIVGLQVSKSIMRILGTLCGAALGLVALILPHNHAMSISMLVLAALFFVTLSSKESDVSYVGILGMATFSMIAFASPPSYKMAGLRVIDIVVGVLISLVVSRFVFPLNSRRAFTLAAKKSFDELSQLVDKLFLEGTQQRNTPETLRLDSKVGASITKLRLIIKALRYESLRESKTTKEDLLQALRYFRAIYRYSLFLDSAIAEGRRESPEITEKWAVIIQSFFKALIELLNDFEINKTLTMEKKAVAQLQENSKLFSQQLVDIKHEQTLIRGQAIIYATTHLTQCAQELMLAWNKINV